MSDIKKTRQRANKQAIITIAVTGNPKRLHTLAHARFELYKDGATVADYVAAGGRTGDVLHDVAQGYITLN